MKRVLAFAVLFILLWSLWTLTGRTPSAVSPVLALDVVQELRIDSNCARNIVGIQPYMVPRDYLSEQLFKEKINGYFEEAKRSGFLNTQSVILLPEYLGTWLVIAGEKESVADAATVTGAMAKIVASNPLPFIRHFMIGAGESDKLAATIFRMKSVRMADIYGRVFQELAKKFEITIVAGSIILPGPVVRHDKILLDHSSPLYNTSFIFHPDGTIDNKATRKSFPISSELPFVGAAPVEELPSFDLPIGRTTAIVCADSWYPQTYEHVKQSHSDIVLVNSYCTGNEAMTKLWRGYDGGMAPADVDLEDINNITEREAWIKYALPARINSSGARVGVNIFLRGALWNLGTDGQPLLVVDGKLIHVQSSDRAGIWSLCF